MSELLVNTIKKADGTGSITVPADSGTLLTSASTNITTSQISDGSMTLIDSGSLSGVTEAYFNDVFTSDYDNYTFILNMLWPSSGDEDLRVRLVNDGITDTNTNYAFSMEYINATLNSGTYADDGSGTGFKIFDNHDNHSFASRVDFFAPTKTGYFTQIRSDSHGYDNGYVKNIYGFGRYKATTNFDGFYIYIAGGSGTMTGAYSVYGWNK